MRDVVAELGIEIPQFVPARQGQRIDWSDEAVDARKTEARQRKAKEKVEEPRERRSAP